MRPVRLFTIFSSHFLLIFVFMLAICHSWNTSSTKSEIIYCARFDPFTCAVLLRKKYKRTACSLVGSCILPLKCTILLRYSPSSNGFSRESLDTADGFRSSTFLNVNLVNGRIIELLQAPFNTCSLLLVRSYFSPNTISFVTSHNNVTYCIFKPKSSRK